MNQLIPFLLLLSLIVGPAPVLADDQQKTETGGSKSSSDRIGNIQPYRKDLLMRIASNWHPKNNGTLTVDIRVGQDGKLVSVSIFKSSLSKDADQQALDSIKATKFAPLPDWYHEKSIQFRVDMEKVPPAQK